MSCQDLICTAVACCVLTIGCSADTERSPLPTRAKLLAELEQLDRGTITIRVNVNSLADALVSPISEGSTSLQVPPALLEQGNNTIEISFVLQRPDLAPVSLATTSSQFFYTGSANTITLQGTDYRYPDDDSDTVPNLLELLIRPADIDNDGEENLLDTDSDGDGTDDGLDVQPYGPPAADNILPAIATFDVEQDEQAAQSISITRLTGAGTVASTLDTATSPLRLIEPANWPWALPIDLSAIYWQLIELPIANTTLCPRAETAIDIDTSSFQASVSQPIIGYYERFDGTPFSVPIQSGNITDLSAFTRNDVAIGNPSLDNALRALLVPANSAGFISLWTRDSFTGDQCQINLATANSPQ